MKRTLVAAALAAVPVLALELPSATPDDAALAERGRYLVHDLAQCVQCHSGRLPSGELDRARLLRGGLVPFESPFRDAVWATYAPRIAGLPGYTDDEAVRLFTTGVAHTGRPLRGPMPPYRMTPEDARAVVAYLRAAP